MSREGRLEGVERIVAVLMGLHGAMILLYWLSEWQQGSATQRDWYTYQRAARQLVDGDWSFYATDFFSDPHRYLYPPYGVWYFTPLAWTTGSWGYVAVVASQLAAAAGALWLLRRDLRPLVLGAVVGSTWLFFDLMIGQIAATLLLCIVAALVLWRRGQPLAAGMVWGLAAIKPQFVWPAVWVAAVADRRVFAGLAVAGVGLALATLPFGVDAWLDFVATAQAQAAYATGELTVTHNASLIGFLKGFLATEPARWAYRAFLPVGLATAGFGAWRHRADPAVCMALATLLGLSLNVYVNTYDLLLLLVPAAVWHARRDHHPIALHRAVTVAFVASWWWDQWVVLYRTFLGLPKSTVGSAGGLLAFGWLLAWAVLPPAPPHERNEAHG